MSEATKRVWLFGFYNISLMLLVTLPYYILTSEVTFNSIAETNTGKSLLFISLAGIMKAIMDTLNFHFSNSIFKNLNPYFWDEQNYAWKNKYKNRVFENGRRKLFGINIPVVFTSGWHLFQSFQINFLMLAIVFYEPLFTWYFDFCIYGFMYRAFFFLFYNYYLIKK